jgi:hypothetical protein
LLKAARSRQGAQEIRADSLDVVVDNLRVVVVAPDVAYNHYLNINDRACRSFTVESAAHHQSISRVVSASATTGVNTRSHVLSNANRRCRFPHRVPGTKRRRPVTPRNPGPIAVDRTLYQPATIDHRLTYRPFSWQQNASIRAHIRIGRRQATRNAHNIRPSRCSTLEPRTS